MFLSCALDRQTFLLRHDTGHICPGKGFGSLCLVLVLAKKGPNPGKLELHLLFFSSLILAPSEKSLNRVSITLPGRIINTTDGFRPLARPSTSFRIPARSCSYSSGKLTRINDATRQRVSIGDIAANIHKAGWNFAANSNAVPASFASDQL